MKRLTLVSTLLVLLVAWVACGGGGKYADAKAAMEKMIKIHEDFIEGLNNADNGKAVAAAMTDYAEEMGKLKATMEELEKKYPELKGAEKGGDQVPEELKPVMEKLKEVMPKMFGAMMKVQQYAQDPDVQAAQAKMQSAMQ